VKEAGLQRINESYRSYWTKSAPGPAYPTLEADRSCDVAVLGGGIVEVTAALELAKAGAEVVLLEARRIGLRRQRPQHRQGQLAERPDLPATGQAVRYVQRLFSRRRN
jgi:monoamine oxidase